MLFILNMNNLKVEFSLCFVLLLLISTRGLSEKDLEKLFEDKECIEGQLVFGGSSVMLVKKDLHTEETVTVPDSNELKQHLLVTLPTAVQDEKNYLVLLNELAQFNDVKIDFLIISEEGPPHDRIFKLRLNLGKESYFVSEKSIKKAKLLAAQEALAQTKYKQPPQTIKTAKQVEQLTPTVQLNNVAAKLGIKVEYINENDQQVNEHDLLDSKDSTQNYYYLDHTSKTYVQKLNESLHKGIKVKNMKIPSGEKGPQGPFKIRLIVGREMFFGTDVTIQGARHNAALNALNYFKQMSLNDAEECLAKGEVCNKLSTKSPVSLLYETAQSRGLSVECEIVESSGPDHKKEFVTLCKVGDIAAKGEGPSKKASKRKAAEKLLLELGKVEEIPIGNSIRVNTEGTSKKKKKKKKIGRGILDNVRANVVDAVNSVTTVFDGQPDEDTSEDASYDESTEDSEKSSNKNNLLKLGKDIGLDVQFSSFETDGKYSTIVGLNMDPSYVCFNQDISKDSSEEKAAQSALMLIKNIGFDNIVIPLKDSKDSKPKIVLPSKIPEVHVINKKL